SSPSGGHAQWRPDWDVLADPARPETGHISWRSGLNPMTLANSTTRWGCAEGAPLERSVIMMRRLFETSCLAGMVIIGAAAQSGGFGMPLTRTVIESGSIQTDSRACNVRRGGVQKGEAIVLLSVCQTRREKIWRI